MPQLPTADREFILLESERILSSYRRWLGRDLLPPQEDPLQRADALFLAPFVVAASNDEADPILVYGNRRALDLWELPWEEFTRTPARKTAEPMERAARESFLERVRKDGHVEDYAGIRVSNTGRRFRIRRATVWNLLDGKGRYCGQAAAFSRWEYLA